MSNRHASWTVTQEIYLDQVGVARVPENYDLRVSVRSIYDLALSKLERNIQRDRDDVKHLPTLLPFDLQVLKERYNRELRWQLGNLDRENLTLRLWIEAIGEEQKASLDPKAYQRSQEVHINAVRTLPA